MSTSRRGNSAAVVSPTSWSKASSQASRTATQSKTRLSVSPFPSAKEKIGDRSLLNKRQPSPTSAVLRPKNNTIGSANDKINDEAYESDGNVSIPASFTRTMATLNVDNDFEVDDDENVFYDVPTFQQNSVSDGVKTASKTTNHIEPQPLQSPSRAQAVSESWDEDFVFSREASREDTRDADKEGYSSSDSLDEDSKWDSDDSREDAAVLTEGATSWAAGEDSKSNHLHRTASSQTIIPSDRQGQGFRADTAQSLYKAPRTPLKSTAAVKSSEQRRSPLTARTAKIPDRTHSLMKPAVATVPRQTPKTPTQTQQQIQPENNSSPPKSGVTSSSIKLGRLGKPKVVGEASIGSATATKSDPFTVQKRKSFGKMEVHFAKIFSSRIGRRKDGVPSVQAESFQPNNTKEIQKTQVGTPSAQSFSLPRNEDLSSSVRTQNVGHVSVGSNTLASPSVNSERLQPKTVGRNQNSECDLELTRTVNRGSISTISPRRTLSKQSRMEISGSEHRQWASMLEDESPAPKTPRSMQASSPVERRAGKRKISDANEKRILDESLPANKQTDLVGPSMLARHTGEGRTRGVGARSVSGSTTTSGGRTSSAASSLSTVATVESATAARLSEATASTQLRRSRFSPSVAKDEEGMSSSTDSKQSRGLRSSTPRKPPPVSSGLDTLSRRKASLTSFSHAMDAASTMDETLSRQGETHELSAHRASARRNSLGDLKIPHRISMIQDGVRADMIRIRNFASGIEDLKGLREAYQRALDRFASHQAGEDVNPVAGELKRSQYTFESWWECAEVLIGLADGKEMTGYVLNNNSSDSLQRPRVSPTPSMQSSILGTHHRQGSVRRHGDQGPSSRASSNASRYVHPEREKEILAAMLAGTPPAESTSPPRATSGHALQRERTISTDEHVRHSPSAPIFIQKKSSSQRTSMEARRTSDSIKENDAARKLEIDVALANGSPQRRPTRKSGIPIPLSAKYGKDGADILGIDITRHGSGGRRRLRSAGQAGLQGLRDLVITIRTNSTLRNRPAAPNSAIPRPTPSRSQAPSRDKNELRRQATADGAVAAVTATAVNGERPQLFRAAATVPTIRRSSHVSSDLLEQSSGLYNHDTRKDLSLDSDWTEADPDRFLTSYDPLLDSSTSTTNGSFVNLGCRSSESTMPKEVTISSHCNEAAAANGLSNDSTSSLNRQKYGSRTAGDLRSHAHAEAPTTPSARPRMAANILLRRDDKAPSSVRRASGSLLTERNPSLPPLMRHRSPTTHEQISSTDSSSWSGSGSVHGRMRVMSADHIDVAAVQRNDVASNTLRELAMRPEAIPSLNRYLDATRAQCRECLSVLKQLEALLSQPPLNSFTK